MQQKREGGITAYQMFESNNDNQNKRLKWSSSKYNVSFVITPSPCSRYQPETEESPADADSREGRKEATAGRWAGRHVPP